MNLISYLGFIGMGLYFLSGVMFFYLFSRTLWTKDGIGLLFLRWLTFALSFGSFVIFAVRFLGTYAGLDPNLSRAIAIVNPIVLIMTALYLNFLFHHKDKPLSLMGKDIKKIKSDTKAIKEDTIIIKENTK